VILFTTALNRSKNKEIGMRVIAKRHLVLALLIPLIPLLPAFGSGNLPRSARPNIVVIYADDLGYGDVQCYNPERVAEMQTLLENLIIRGRSTPGPEQKNDVPVRRYPPNPEESVQ
jgi:hypothetical protein